MTEAVFYAVRWVLTDSERYLLWRDGGSGPDEYASVKGSSKLLIARSEQELIHAATRDDLRVSDAAPHVIDLRAARSVLNSLRPRRAMSERSARVLLETWNALEDLERSIGGSFMTSPMYAQKEIEVAYEKLFYGNNLPSVTPNDTSYLATLSDGQREMVRALLRNAMRGAESCLT